MDHPSYSSLTDLSASARIAVIDAGALGFVDVAIQPLWLSAESTLRADGFDVALLPLRAQPQETSPRLGSVGRNRVISRRGAKTARPQLSPGV